MTQREDRSSNPFNDEPGPGARPMSSGAQQKALALLDRILAMSPGDDNKLTNHLLLLRRQIEQEEREQAESQKLLAEYEEAYQKLTSPANRLGTFLGGLDDDSGAVTVALGDGEYVCQVDPQIEAETLRSGNRVRLNEAFAVVGDLGPWPNGSVVRVAEAPTDDSRIRVSLDSTGQQSRVVARGAGLAETKLVEGDEVRLDPLSRVALEHFPRQEARDFFLEEIPELPWERVGGQEEAIRVIRDAIEKPLLHPELYAAFEKKPLKGILLFGPPGCGKTLIGKATAYNLTREYSRHVGHEVKEYFMFINGPKILNMWLGESERMVREIFATAREKAREGRLVFIFIDEAEAILRTRSSGRYLNIANTVVPQFAAEMDGLVSLENVVVMLTSNRPDYIDPAILRPERIDRKVKVIRPDRAASRDIFSIYLRPALPLDPELLETHGDRESARASLVEGATEFLFRRDEDALVLEVHLRNASVQRLYWPDLVSGALITSVVERAKDYAIQRAIAEPDAKHGLRLEDLQQAIRREYRENEIFPKSDTQDDWLKLLDYEAENVVSLRPIRADRPVRGGRHLVM